MITLKKLEEAVGIRRQMEALEKRFASIFGDSETGLTHKRGRRRMSPAARAKIAAAARARWAERRGESTTSVKTKKRGLTPAGRRKLSQMMKARWAARRKATAEKQ
jgi:hypothetical protein